MRYDWLGPACAKTATRKSQQSRLGVRCSWEGVLYSGGGGVEHSIGNKYPLVVSALGFGCVAAGDGVCRKVEVEAGGEMSGNRGTRFGRWGCLCFLWAVPSGSYNQYWAFRDRGMLNVLRLLTIHITRSHTLQVCLSSLRTR